MFMDFIAHENFLPAKYFQTTVSYNTFLWGAVCVKIEH